MITSVSSITSPSLPRRRMTLRSLSSLLSKVSLSPQLRAIIAYISGVQVGRDCSSPMVPVKLSTLSLSMPFTLPREMTALGTTSESILQATPWSRLPLPSPPCSPPLYLPAPCYFSSSQASAIFPFFATYRGTWRYLDRSPGTYMRWHIIWSVISRSMSVTRLIR